MNFNEMFENFTKDVINGVNEQQNLIKDKVNAIKNIKEEIKQANAKISQFGQDCNDYANYFRQISDTCYEMCDNNLEVQKSLEDVEDIDVISYEEMANHEDEFLDFDDESLEDVLDDEDEDEKEELYDIAVNNLYEPDEDELAEDEDENND